MAKKPATKSAKQTPKRRRPPGNPPDYLKLDGPWGDAVKSALRRGKVPIPKKKRPSF